MNEDLKREVILEHYQNPLHRFVPSDDSYIKVNTRNESCIDNLDIYLKIEDNIIKDIAFDGEACAISISSTSIMIETLVGKTKEEALNIINNFDNMLEEKEYDKDLLKNAVVYDTISKQSSRKTCASLPYRGLKKAIENNKDL